MKATRVIPDTRSYRVMTRKRSTRRRSWRQKNEEHAGCGNATRMREGTYSSALNFLALRRMRHVGQRVRLQTRVNRACKAHDKQNGAENSAIWRAVHAAYIRERTDSRSCTVPGRNVTKSHCGKCKAFSYRIDSHACSLCLHLAQNSSQKPTLLPRRLQPHAQPRILRIRCQWAMLRRRCLQHALSHSSRAFARKIEQTQGNLEGCWNTNASIRLED